MEKVKEFLKKIPDWVKAVVASAVIIAVAVVVSNVVNTAIQRKNDKDYVVSNDLYSMLKDISLTKVDSTLIIQGWAFDTNIYNGSSSCELILQDTETGEALWPKMTENLEVLETIERYTDGEDYSRDCFAGSIKSRRLGEDRVYEVLVRYTADYIDESGNENRYARTVSTDEYIYQGELTAYNPKLFSKPDVTGTDLEAVIQDGNACYFSEEGLYIYKYDNSIYYIAGPEFPFAESGLTEIPLHIYAIAIEKLPEKSQQYGFENMDIIFERYELTGQFGNYRVAVRELPTDYAVTYIRTGFYSTINQKWVWEMISMTDK